MRKFLIFMIGVAIALLLFCSYNLFKVSTGELFNTLQSCTVTLQPDQSTLDARVCWKEETGIVCKEFIDPRSCQ